MALSINIAYSVAAKFGFLLIPRLQNPEKILIHDSILWGSKYIYMYKV